MKKSFITFLSLMVSSTFVSAEYYGNDLAGGLGYGMNQVIDMVEQMLGPFFSAILGGTSEMLFERVLFLAILLAVVYIVVSNLDVFKDNKPVIWIVSISVSLLATRFLVESTLIQAMLLPYSVFGVALSAVIPILIYFKFVHSFSESVVVRKMLWIFYVVAFVGIWSSRYESVGKLSWIYMGSAIAALVFLFFDGTIRRAMIRQQMKELDINNREDFIVKIKKQIAELEGNMTAGYITEATYKKKKRKLNKQIHNIMKN